MFKVYWTNFGYYSPDEFANAKDAVAYGKTKCMDFRVVTESNGVAVAGWSVFGGLRIYDEAAYAETSMGTLGNESEIVS